MKYIIMCGGNYKQWEKPRQLTEINGELLVLRTVRLLRENGVDDIYISTNHPAFYSLGVPILRHHNDWTVYGIEDADGTWVNGFFPTEDTVCYLLGDVVFSPAAIKKIVTTNTDSIQFFASAPPFAEEYKKAYAEPFAFKVVDTQYFRACILKVIQLENEDKFERHPIAWELWQVIKNTPLNEINYTNYVVINDYTCDIDVPDDIKNYRNIL